ncbi:hypothetical protein [Pseudonocardia lacus]|uniref:hypothetical protein n=1 Tax=Pseudonocardia lacus TaxID=2835865 RepID=UPI0027E24324|nr:hypothetical protein [Pseudonocardia lacus]
MLQTYGSGNSPTDRWFLDGLRRAADGGQHVIGHPPGAEGAPNLGGRALGRQRDPQVMQGGAAAQQEIAALGVGGRQPLQAAARRCTVRSSNANRQGWVLCSDGALVARTTAVLTSARSIVALMVPWSR